MPYVPSLPRPGPVHSNHLPQRTGKEMPLPTKDKHVNKALRGWRHKKRRAEERFNRELDAFTARINKHSYMRRIRQLGVTSPNLIHNGRKPL